MLYFLNNYYYHVSFINTDSIIIIILIAFNTVLNYSYLDSNNSTLYLSITIPIFYVYACTYRSILRVDATSVPGSVFQIRERKLRKYTSNDIRAYPIMGKCSGVKPEDKSVVRFTKSLRYYVQHLSGISCNDGGGRLFWTLHFLWSKSVERRDMLLGQTTIFTGKCKKHSSV